MSQNVLNFKPAIDIELIDMIEGLLLRARTGTVLGLALIEHRLGGDVATELLHGPGSYHHMNSGAARLAVALASAQHQGE